MKATELGIWIIKCSRIYGFDSPVTESSKREACMPGRVMFYEWISLCRVKFNYKRPIQNKFLKLSWRKLKALSSSFMLTFRGWFTSGKHIEYLLQTGSLPSHSPFPLHTLLLGPCSVYLSEHLYLAIDPRVVSLKRTIPWSIFLSPWHWRSERIHASC